MGNLKLYSRRPIHVAASSGQAQVVKLLIEYKCDILVKDKEGNTPINLAEKYSHQDSVSILRTAMENKKI